MHVRWGMGNRMAILVHSNAKQLSRKPSLSNYALEGASYNIGTRIVKRECDQAKTSESSWPSGFAGRGLSARVDHHL